MPSSQECATLQGKRDFVGVIKDLEMRRLSWSIQCPPHPPIITMVLIRERGRDRSESERLKTLPCCLKDGGWDHQPRNVGSP